MLSMIILTAIIAVALPNLRITTLTLMRTMLVANAIGILLQAQGCFTHAELFSGVIINDVLVINFIILIFIIIIIIFIYQNSFIIIINKIPITIILLINIIILGAYFIIISNDLITFAIALEIQSFSLYAFTGLSRSQTGTTQAALIYFILGAFSSGLIFLGISIIFSYIGETNFYIIKILINISDSEPIIYIGGIIIFTGLIFKISAAPFHWWGPEVYDQIPTITTLFLIVVPKVSLVAFIIRISNIIGITDINYIINSVVIFSWAIGGVIGLVQTRVKRLIAYSTISHVGWILAGIFSGSILGYGATIFYIAQYSFTTILTFLSLISIGYYIYPFNTYPSNIYSSNIYPSNINSSIMGINNNYVYNPFSKTPEIYDIEKINSLSGFFSRSIIFTTIIAITLFSAAGIPPIIGFYAKLSIIQSLVWGGSWITAIIGILFSVVSAGYYLSIISTILFKNKNSI